MFFNFRIINHLLNFIRNGWYNRKPNDWKVYRAPLPVSAKTYAFVKLLFVLFKIFSFPYYCLIWIDDDARTNWIACQSALERLLVVQRKPVERRFVVVHVCGGGRCSQRIVVVDLIAFFNVSDKELAWKAGHSSANIGPLRVKRAEEQAKEALNALPKERYAVLCVWFIANVD